MHLSCVPLYIGERKREIQLGPFSRLANTPEQFKTAMHHSDYEYTVHLTKEEHKQLEGILKDEEFLLLDEDTYHHFIDYLFYQFRHQEGLILCDTALSVYPSELDFEHKKVGFYFYLGKYQSALTTLDSLLHQDYDHGKILLSKGMLFHGLGQFEKSIIILKKAAKVLDQPEDCFFFLGSAYFNLGNAELAVKYLDSYVTLYPDADEAVATLFQALSETGDWETATLLFEKLVEHNPLSSNVWYWMGHVYGMTQFPEKSFMAFEYSYLLEEENDLALIALIEHCIAHKKYIKGIEFTQEFEFIHGKSSFVYTQLAEFYSLLKDKQKALELARKALKIDPESPPALLIASELMYKSKKYEEAIDLLYKLRSLEPEIESANTMLVKALMNQGYYDDCVEVLLENIESTGIKIKHLKPLAWCFLHLEEYDKGIEICTYAIKKSKTPDFHFLLAFFHMKKGDLEESKSMLNLAQELFPKKLKTFQSSLPELFLLQE